jgi:hypothetical protein
MRPPYPLVFASSLSVLSFELLLIRIFTIRLSYHYASLIISLSMAGLVIGGLSVYYMQNSGKFNYFLSSQPLNFFAAALAVSYPSVFLLFSVIPLDHARMLWDHPQILYLILFIALCAFPFFLYGVIISLALSAWKKRANKIYASDLLGGAAGLLLVVFLMSYLKVEYVLLISTGIVGFFIVLRLEKNVSRIFLASILLVLCLPIGSGMATLTISPYKGLMQALKDDDARHISTIYSSHSRLDLFENPRMKFAPGLSLAYTGQVPQGMGISLDGDIAGVVIDEKGIMQYDFFLYVPSALPYLLVHPENVVIIGAKNCIDLLQPRYFVTPHVYAAEYDASVLDFLSTQQWVHSPNPVSIFDSSGRNLLKKFPKETGLIFVSRTGFYPSGSFGLQEDYDLTVEAIETYLARLKDGGVLFIQMFLLPPPRYELRLVKNIHVALKRTGIQKIHKHFIIYRSWDTVNFLVKKDGFSEEDFDKTRQFLTSRQFDLLYPDNPGQEQFITGLDYKGLFRQVLQGESPTDFGSSYIFDIRETTDDRPFFHSFLKIGKIKEIYEIAGRKWVYFLHEGMFLPFILLILAFISVSIFVFTLLFIRHVSLQLKTKNSSVLPSSKTTATEDGKLKTASLVYFSLIGFAFMFIEVFFIHRLILPFGSPVRAFSITLVTILLSAGIGSLATGWIAGRKMMWIMGLAPLLAVACYFLFDLVDETTLSAVFMVPIGIVLGFFFPVGLRFLISEETGGVPLAYAANGAASIIAPSLASLLAVAYGCNILLILAAILYALAVVIILPVILRISRSFERL